jgi:hypothetical protein
MHFKTSKTLLGTALSLGLVAVTLVACGGGGGSSSSSIATTYGGGKGLSCTGSHGAGQTAFESVILAANGGYYGANWWFPGSVPALLDNVITTIPASPDAGVQLVSQIAVAGSNTLPAQTPTPQSIRALGTDGQLHAVQSEPIHLNAKVSYNCDDTILQKIIATDGSGVLMAEETIHSVQTVALSGPVLSNTVPETLNMPVPPRDSGFMGFLNLVSPGLYTGNTAINYAAGSKFLIFKKTAFTDAYKVKKCTIVSLLASTGDTDACGKLDILQADPFVDALIKIGIPAPLSTGSIYMAYGQKVWKETAITPVVTLGASTNTHRFAIAINGDLFVGKMVEAGTDLWDDEEYAHSQGSPQATSIWHRHANQQAANSIKQVLNF